MSSVDTQAPMYFSSPCSMQASIDQVPTLTTCVAGGSLIYPSADPLSALPMLSGSTIESSSNTDLLAKLELSDWPIFASESNNMTSLTGIPLFDMESMLPSLEAGAPSTFTSSDSSLDIGISASASQRSERLAFDDINVSPQLIKCPIERAQYSSDTVVSLRVRRNAVFVPRSFTETVLNLTIDQHKLQECTTRKALIPLPLPRQNKKHSRSSSCDSQMGNFSAKGYSRHVNEVLLGWVEEHSDNPYPSAKEKQKIMEETGLTKMQLKNWFCNIRRRKLAGSIKRPQRGSCRVNRVNKR